MIYSDEIGTATGVGTTYSAMTGSPYSPLLGGRLIQLRLMLSGDAVTSLIEEVVCKVSCSLWGVDAIVSGVGGNIRTAPAFPIPVAIQNVDLPVKTGVQIKAEFKHTTGATPVTPQIKLIGVFEG